MKPGRVSEVPPAARRTLARAVTWPAWVVLAAAAVFFAAGSGLPELLLYLPFALSLVAFGLPHGALDHLVPDRLSGRGATAGSVLGVALLYLALGSLYLALWFAAPAVAFAMFIALTWFHWGQGDLYALRALFRAGHLETLPRKALAVAVRGGLPMLVPLLVSPEVYREVAEGAVGLFGAGLVDPLSRAFEPEFRVVAGLMLAALAVLYLISGLRGAGSEKHLWSLDAFEIALLAAYFTVVPPVFAVGLYFCLWHSVRHVVRLALLEGRPGDTPERWRLAPALWRFVRDAVPLTLAALVLLGGLYVVAPERAGEPLSLLGLYLVLLSVLTLPHVVVVSLMDRRQGLWR